MRTLTRLVVSLVALVGVSPSVQAQFDDGALLVQCQKTVTPLAAQFERSRRAALGHCARKALQCPDVLTSSTTASSDACLAAVATKCQAAIDAQAQSGAPLLAALTGCTQPVGSVGVSIDEVTGDDGLAYEHLIALCPQAELTADALSQCQSRVLVCNADLQFTKSVPRGAELLARLGLPLDDSGCIGNTPCGNGEVDPGEQCDDGVDNSDTDPDACRTNCMNPHCGDGVTDSDEQCDDGNAVAGDGCETDCTLTPGPTCGDGTIDAGEECDDGPANSNTAPDACRLNCLDPYCGDGVVDSDEECDDGNAVDGDGCDTDCTLTVGSYCGDGNVDPGEECDDGPGNSDTTPDACRTDCTDPRCGDGVVDPGNGEECEPPGTIVCSSDCGSLLPSSSATASVVAPDATASHDDLVRCQGAILDGTRSLYDRTVALEERCVSKVLQCTFGISEDSDPDGIKSDACFEHANTMCLKVSTKRDALLTKQVAKLGKKCTTGTPPVPIAVASLVDVVSGLGFQTDAQSCPANGGQTVDDAALFDCVYHATECVAEGTVSRAAPSAADLLGQLDLDATTVFPCVTDLQGD